MFYLLTLRTCLQSERCVPILVPFSLTSQFWRRMILSEIGAKFRHLYRTSGLLSKNMTSDFAPELAKYLTSSPIPQNFWRVRTDCFALLAIQLVIQVVDMCRPRAGVFSFTMQSHASTVYALIVCLSVCLCVILHRNRENSTEAKVLPQSRPIHVLSLLIA